MTRTPLSEKPNTTNLDHLLQKIAALVRWSQNRRGVNLSSAFTAQGDLALFCCPFVAWEIFSP